MAKFLKFIVNMIMIVAIVVAASLLVPPFAGVTTWIVDDIEMETNLDIGSVTYAWGVDAGELEVGDKVLLQENGTMLYSISSVEGNEFVLEDTLSTDGETVTNELQGIVDRVVLTIPVLGYVSMALRTVEGLIIVGLSVIFVIILFVLSEIWRKEEEDDWEEESEEESDDTDKKECAQKDVEENSVNKNTIEQTEHPGQLVQNSENDVQSGEVLAEDSEKSEMEESITVSEGFSQAEKDLFEETGNFLAADIASMMGIDAQQDSEREEKRVEETVRKLAETENSKEPKEKVLAMPSYTKEELLERAKAAGDEPELVMDELSGVTFLDYSDVL